MPEIKRLYGDGITNDTKALQALLDGESVIMPDGKTVQQAGVIALPAGTYVIDATLRMNADNRLSTPHG